MPFLGYANDIEVKSTVVDHTFVESVPGAICQGESYQATVVNDQLGEYDAMRLYIKRPTGTIYTYYETPPSFEGNSYIFNFTVNEDLDFVWLYGSGFRCCLTEICGWEPGPNVRVEQNLETPTYISGSQYMCRNQGTVFSTFEPNAEEYTWKVPNSSWTIEGFSGPQRTFPASEGYQVTIVPGSGVSGGNYTVSVRADLFDCDGDGFFNKSVNVVTSPLSSPVLFLNGSSDICNNPSYEYNGHGDYFASSVSGAINYSWQVTTTGGSVLLSATTGTSWGFYGNEVGTGTRIVKVRPNNACGSSASWNTYQITVHPTPSAYCPDGPEQIIVPLDYDIDYLIYPNPVDNGKLFIEATDCCLENEIMVNYEFTLSNGMGTPVPSGSSKKSINEVNISSLKDGLYYLNIVDQQREFQQQIWIEAGKKK